MPRSFRSRVLFPALLAAIVAGTFRSAFAATIDVGFTLKAGWNAVYVPVGCDATPDELFADWPVPSVSAYSAASYRSTASTAGGATGESEARVPFLIWTREAPAASSLKALVADTVLVCCNTSSAPRAVALRGTPVAPRIAWHKTEDGGDAYNYVGVRLNDGASVRAADYFAGCAARSGSNFYELKGAEASCQVSRLGGFSSTAAAKLSDGQVVLVPGASVSDWSGPLYVTPRIGLAFGETATQSELAIRNDGAAAKDVTVRMIPSTTTGENAPTLLARHADEEVINPDWETMTPNGLVLSRTLATGETWRVSVAVDRTKLLGTGKTLGAIFEIAETGGTEMRVDVPVTVDDVKSANAWPRGLWALDITLDRVTRYVKDTKAVEDVKAGGTMKLRVYVFVADDGAVSLLPRVTVAGVKKADGTITRTLYGPDAALPSGLDYARRLSSAALPVDVGAVAAASGSSWGEHVAFDYRIAATSGSNPFRHALHPMFDGKDANFEPLAYDGDDFANYAKTVKPELFSIGGRVVLDWDSSDGAAWNPDESMTGACSWIYTGLMRQGPVTAHGTFVAQRVVATQTLVE